MNYFIAALQIVGFAILSFFVYQLSKKVSIVSKDIQKFSTSIVDIHKRIDQIFVVDIPSPNEATKVDTNEIDLSETASHQIPKDVKLDIEGGDSQTPPGFEEKK